MATIDVEEDLPKNQQKNKLKVNNHPQNQQKNKVKKNDEVRPITVLAKNLTNNQTVEDIRRIFGKFGEISNISLRDIDGTVKMGHVGPIDQKIHVLIDYITTLSAANDAVSNLNDDSNWRSGMRVQILTEATTSKYKNKKKKKKNKKKQDHNICEEKEKLQWSSIQQPECNGIGKNKKQDRNLSVQNQQQPKQYLKPCTENDSKWRSAIGSTSTCSKIPFNKCIPKIPDGTRGFTINQ